MYQNYSLNGYVLVLVVVLSHHIHLGSCDANETYFEQSERGKFTGYTVPILVTQNIELIVMILLLASVT